MRQIHDEFRKGTVKEIDGDRFRVNDTMFDDDKTHLEAKSMKKFWMFYIKKILPHIE